jgi:nitrilase
VAEPAAAHDPLVAAGLKEGDDTIVSPFGEVLAGPVYGEDAVLEAELDLAEIARGKFDLDVVGHHARPDVFQLSVDERPRQAVVRQPPGTPQEARARKSDTPSD